jgi:hypothetical protein
MLIAYAIILTVFIALLIVLYGGDAFSWLEKRVYIISVLIFFPLFILTMRLYKLETTVTHESVTVKVGWRKRIVPISSIESVGMETFPSRKWLGYVRYKGNMCFIAEGANRGLWIEVKDGKSFMVSSARPEEFERAVNMAMCKERPPEPSGF